MADINDVLKRYKKLDLHNQAIVTRAVRILKSIDMKSIEETYKDIYYLSTESTRLLLYIIRELEIYDKGEWISEERRKELMKFIEIGSSLCWEK